MPPRRTRCNSCSPTVKWCRSTSTALLPEAVADAVAQGAGAEQQAAQHGLSVLAYTGWQLLLASVPVIIGSVLSGKGISIAPMSAMPLSPMTM